ncbi:MAG TPA: PAS domain S-box protein [Flavisolibacter sp.]|nr:PAS domain S-box protein [Flavisolibacter sp.]
MANSFKKNGAQMPHVVSISTHPINRYASYLFQVFLNHSGSLCWILDREARLVFANKALRQCFHLYDDATGKDLFSLLSKDLRLLLQEAFATEWKGRDYKESVVETTLVDGRKQVFAVKSFRLHEINSEEYYGGMAVDISEKDELEKKLFECNENWLAFTQNAFQGVWEWEVNTALIRCNESLKQLMGYEAEQEFTVEDWLHHIHPLDVGRVRKNIEAALVGEKNTWEEEYRFLTRDGETKTILDRGWVIHHERQPYKLVGLVLDVSEIKELETNLLKERRANEHDMARSLLEAQERERTYIGQELHDNIGQIITTARLVVDMIHSDSPEQRKLQQKCRDMLNDALNEIRKLSNEMALPELKANGIQEAIASLLQDFQLVTSINIVYENAVDELEALEMYKKIALFRILQEQLKNIVKHAKANNVFIQVRHKHGLVELEIKDDGVGFHTGRVRRGVGLSSLFERTKLCNGNMKIESSPGKGTRLLMVFPFGNHE